MDDFSLLNEILSSADAPAQDTGFGPQWEAVFGNESTSAGRTSDLSPQWHTVFGEGSEVNNSDQGTIAQDTTSSFLPSQLLNQFTTLHTSPSMFSYILNLLI